MKNLNTYLPRSILGNLTGEAKNTIKQYDTKTKNFGQEGITRDVDGLMISIQHKPEKVSSNQVARSGVELQGSELGGPRPAITLGGTEPPRKESNSP